MEKLRLTQQEYRMSDLCINEPIEHLANLLGKEVSELTKIVNQLRINPILIENPDLTEKTLFIPSHEEDVSRINTETALTIIHQINPSLRATYVKESLDRAIDTQTQLIALLVEELRRYKQIQAELNATDPMNHTHGKNS